VALLAWAARLFRPPAAEWELVAVAFRHHRLPELDVLAQVQRARATVVPLAQRALGLLVAWAGLPPERRAVELVVQSAETRVQVLPLKVAVFLLVPYSFDCITQLGPNNTDHHAY
jgi:hypothetical protein